MILLWKNGLFRDKGMPESYQFTPKLYPNPDYSRLIRMRINRAMVAQMSGIIWNIPISPVRPPIRLTIKGLEVTAYIPRAKMTEIRPRVKEVRILR
jgi:hypothetical protein